ncbi:MAG: hypothetical protein PXX73_05435 [Sideroxydans sp.]|nr:hypothetical protein [Sideroxydans sp.]
MQAHSRIPKLSDTTFDGALLWFSELQCSGLLFHPEDDPADILLGRTNDRLFSEREIAEVRFLINELEERIGHEQVIKAAYPIFMKAFGIQVDA